MLKEYANLPWGQVHMRRVLGGDRSLILLHQAPSSSEMWEPVIGLFADRGYAVTAIDLPGHGMSDPPPAEPDVQWYGEAILEVLDAIGSQAVRIVGHHTGASVALSLAAQAPDRVAALALWGIPLLDPAYAHRLATEEPPKYDEEGKFLADTWAFWQQRSTPECRPTVPVRAIKEALLTGDCRPYGHRAVGRADHRALLEAVRCPVLGMAGAREMLAEQTREAVALLRNGTYVDLGDAGIDVADQMPERFVAEIDTFFAHMNGGPELYSSPVQVDATAARPYVRGRRMARDLGLPARLLRLTAEDGYPLDAALVEPRVDNPVAAVIHLHGKGGNFYTGPGRFIPERTQHRPIVHLALNMRFHDLGYTRDDQPSPDFASGDVPVGGGFWEQISAGHLDVAAAVGFLRDQGHERVFVLGHSSGGYYAVDYAARGDDVTGLVLLSPLTTNRTALPRWFPGEGELEEALSLARKMIAEGRGGHLIPLPSWYYAISARSLVERAADPEHAWEESLAGLKCPVLMLWGETESRHGLWSGIVDRAGRPELQHVSLPGCEHNYSGFEDTVTKAVADFVTAK